MRKTILAAALGAAAAVPGLASAQAAAQSPHTVTGNVAIVSDYRFRGISQTFADPAIQGGIDYAHSSGFYLGNWNTGLFTWIHLYLWPTLIMLDVLLVFVLYLRYLARKTAPHAASA